MLRMGLLSSARDVLQYFAIKRTQQNQSSALVGIEVQYLLSKEHYYQIDHFLK